MMLRKSNRFFLIVIMLVLVILGFSNTCIAAEESGQVITSVPEIKEEELPVKENVIKESNNQVDKHSSQETLSPETVTEELANEETSTEEFMSTETTTEEAESPETVNEEAESPELAIEEVESPEILTEKSTSSEKNIEDTVPDKELGAEKEVDEAIRIKDDSKVINSLDNLSQKTFSSNVVTNSSLSNQKVYNSEYFINRPVNVRDTNNQIIGRRYPGELIKAVKNGSYYEFLEDNQIKKVYYTYVSEFPVKGQVQTKGIINVRDSISGEVIGSFNKGIYIRGYSDGKFIYFNYEGKRAKVYLSVTNYTNYLTDDKDSDFGVVAEKGRYYLLRKSTVYNSKFKPVDYKFKGQVIFAIKEGNYYKFIENGEDRYIDPSDIQSKPILGGAYLLGPSNIRDFYTNKLVASYHKGKYLTGINDGSKILFTLDGKYSSIYTSLFVYDLPQDMYVTTTVNVRNSSNEIIGIKLRGQVVHAVKLGNQYRFYENSTENFIWHEFVSGSKQEIQAFTLAETNIIERSTGQVIGRNNRGDFIQGYIENGNVISTHLYKEVVYPLDKLVEFNPSEKIIKKHTNYRSLDLDYLGTIKDDMLIMSSSYNSSYDVFFINGKARLVYSSLLAEPDSSEIVDNPSIPNTSSKRMIKIVLDPGHGPGIDSNRGALLFNEGDQNFEFSQLLLKEADKYYGAWVTTTRETNEDYPSLEERAYAGCGVDMFISLHTNAGPYYTRGTEVFGSMHNLELNLPVQMSKFISTLLNTNNRGVKYRTYYDYILKTPDPAFTDYWGVFRGNSATQKYLVEFAFHSNMDDSISYLNNQETLAKGMMELIANHYGLVKIAE